MEHDYVTRYYREKFNISKKFKILAGHELLSESDDDLYKNTETDVKKDGM